VHAAYFTKSLRKEVSVLSKHKFLHNHFHLHLPVIVDPSHGTGIRSLVAPMARAAMACGADGVIVEVHHDPDNALSDGAQSLYPWQLAELIKQLRAMGPALGKEII